MISSLNAAASSRPKHGHRGERPAPAELRGDHAAEAHADHRAERPTGHEGTSQSGVHPWRKDAEHQRDSDAAVGGLTDADQEAGDQHVLVAAGQGAPQGGEAPQDRHHDQAAYATPPVRQHRHRKGEQTDHQRDDAGERRRAGNRSVTIRP